MLGGQLTHTNLHKDIDDGQEKRNHARLCEGVDKQIERKKERKRVITWERESYSDIVLVTAQWQSLMIIDITHILFVISLGRGKI